MPDKRHIALEGSYNTRDIGGYTIDKDRVTRSHRYIRCDGMHRLTDEDQNKLTDYGLKTIIDSFLLFNRCQWIRVEDEAVRPPPVSTMQ